MVQLLLKDKLLCPLFAQYLKTRNDFNLMVFKRSTAAIQNTDIETFRLFMQFCICFDCISKSQIDDPCFYYNICIPRRNLRLLHVHNQEDENSIHIKYTTDDFQKDLYYNIIKKTRATTPILYSLVVREQLTLSQDLSISLMKFCENIFLLSPRTYLFIKRIIANLFAKSTIVDSLSTKIEVYQEALTYTNISDIGEKIGKLLDLRLPDRGCTILAALGGDAASIVDNTSNGRIPKNLYCFELLPLNWQLPAFPLHYQVYNPGSCPGSTKKIFTEIIRVLQSFNIKVIFKCVDGETTMNEWFDTIFGTVLTKETLTLPFDQVIELCKKHAFLSPWPISDLLHLLKCGRAHAQGHLICLDLSHFICLNLTYFIQATGLTANLNDKSTQARMNDQYALEFFSYDALVRLIIHGRYDGAFYIFLLFV